MQSVWMETGHLNQLLLLVQALLPLIKEREKKRKEREKEKGEGEKEEKEREDEIKYFPY